MTDRDPDIWASLRGSTRARLGLGRAGNALPLAATLDFQLAHAKARDAVWKAADFPSIERALGGLPTIAVTSRAVDRSVYIRRPDLGRRLAPAGVDAVSAHRTGAGWDIVFIIGDGLSSPAIDMHAAPLVQTCMARLRGLSIAPIILASQARVALSDEIGERIGARLSVILIGERPGLSSADSLGAYLTWAPAAGRTDAERNCVSNIHAAGLPNDVAADRICWLAREALRLKLSGVDLKDDTPRLGIAADQRQIGHSE